MTTTTDDGFAAGDAAWGEARQMLSRFVGRRVPPGEVEDILGDIMLQALSYRGGLEGASNPFAWLRRVATSKIADHYRQAARRGVAVALPEEFPDDPGEDPSALEELTSCVKPMIARLPDKYARALMLSDIEGRRQADAAKAMGLTLSAFKSRLRRGRLMLRSALLCCCAVELDRRGRISKDVAADPGCHCDDKEEPRAAGKPNKHSVVGRC